MENIEHKSTVETRYNNTSLCDTSPMASNIL
jgi:hypothetical protein